MDQHPTQPHIVATGGQDGTLYLWDMRQEKYPITLLEAHSSNSKTVFIYCGFQYGLSLIASTMSDGCLYFQWNDILLSYLVDSQLTWSWTILD